MTDTIYQNPFVFEKHGQSFSDYIGLCITHFRNEKGENTQRHHIHPKCMTGGVYIEERWNWVHLPYELHQKSHELLADTFKEHNGLAFAANSMSGRELPEGWIPWNKGLKTGKPAWNSGKTGLQEPWNKGKTGVYTDETIQKMGEANKGKTPWNKGLVTPEETLNKARGQKRSAETRLKQRTARLGKEPWNKGKTGVQTAWNKGMTKLEMEQYVSSNIE